MTKCCFPVQTRAETRGVPEETETASEKESSQESVDETETKEEAVPLKGKYGAAQLNDRTLTNALRNIRVVEGVDKQQGHLTYP